MQYGSVLEPAEEKEGRREGARFRMRQGRGLLQDIATGEDQIQVPSRQVARRLALAQRRDGLQNAR